MTTNNPYIKEIKGLMKQVKGALKQLEETEKKLGLVRNVREYDKAQNDAKDAALSMMQALEEAVRLASVIGCENNLYDMHKYHKVIEFDFRDSHE